MPRQVTYKWMKFYSWLYIPTNFFIDLCTHPFTTRPIGHKESQLANFTLKFFFSVCCKFLSVLSTFWIKLDSESALPAKVLFEELVYQVVIRFWFVSITFASAIFVCSSNCGPYGGRKFSLPIYGWPKFWAVPGPCQILLPYPGSVSIIFFGDCHPDQNIHVQKAQKYC